MFIEFGDFIISSNCIACIQCGKRNFGMEYFIRIVFNRKVKENWDCILDFKTEEEMKNKWNELKRCLCPIQVPSYGAGYGCNLPVDISPDFIKEFNHNLSIIKE